MLDDNQTSLAPSSHLTEAKSKNQKDAQNLQFYIVHTNIL